MTTKPIDYSALSDQELRVLVAKAVGYRAVEYQDWWFLLEPHQTIGGLATIIANDTWGIRSANYRGFPSEERAWELSDRYPEYSKSLDACYLLMLAYSLQWEVGTWEPYYGQIMVKDSKGFICVLDASSPARALCTVFLMWQDKNN